MQLNQLITKLFIHSPHSLYMYSNKLPISPWWLVYSYSWWSQFVGDCHWLSHLTDFRAYYHASCMSKIKINLNQNKFSALSKFLRNQESYFNFDLLIFTNRFEFYNLSLIKIIAADWMFWKCFENSFFRIEFRIEQTW